ncbi:hypothetical protein I3H72_003356 [Salmonella enterica subsp. enterica]|nr:hypothetical protein [Salmonella enterica subsp. enterica]
MAYKDQITPGIFIGIVLCIGCIKCQIADQCERTIDGKCASRI